MLVPKYSEGDILKSKEYSGKYPDIIYIYHVDEKEYHDGEKCIIYTIQKEDNKYMEFVEESELTCYYEEIEEKHMKIFVNRLQSVIGD